jgi:predicted DNA-binding WGR domain protein
MKIVDKLVPDRNAYTVHEEYGVLLNQTNINSNNNKFYVVQILYNTKKDTYSVWTRWGRVGENGKSNNKECDNSTSSIKEFKKVFKSKTGNAWNTPFVEKSEKYCVVEIENKEETTNDSSPMGKLTEKQIEKGQAVLKMIEKELEKSDSDDTNSDELESDVLIDLSSKFFTLIPVSTGRKKPTPITTITTLREKEELLKFYLRMGFQNVDDNKKLTPLTGIMELQLLPTLKKAMEKVCSLAYINSAIKKGAELEKKNAGNPTIKLDKELYGAIMLYTSNAIYSELNTLLRSENRSMLEKYMNYLRMFLEALVRLPKNNVTLWRGISVDLSTQYKVGDTVTWWGVSSCTSAKSVAEGFMHSCGGNCSFLTIDSKTATDISEISFYSSEKESLLAPGTQLLVKSINKENKIAYIHLEEVGSLIKI